MFLVYHIGFQLMDYHKNLLHYKMYILLLYNHLKKKY